MKALKLFFFADRYHLRKYGRPIFNDEYFAMNYGPVPSGAKDLVEGSDFRPAVEKAYSGQFIDAVDRYEYASIAAVEEAVFSTTDRESLAYVWDHFGALDKFALADMSHKYPEWKKREAALVSECSSRVKMSFLDFLDDPEEGVDPCYDLDDEERVVRREEVEELASFHALWN